MDLFVSWSFSLFHVALGCASRCLAPLGSHPSPATSRSEIHLDVEITGTVSRGHDRELIFASKLA